MRILRFLDIKVGKKLKVKREKLEKPETVKDWFETFYFLLFTFLAKPYNIFETVVI